MAAALENCKGHVHVVTDEADGGQSSGFYAISPPIPEGAGSKVLILGIPLEFQEITQATTTLDDKRILYVFGTAWNSISVAGMLLLGDQKTKGEQLSQLIRWYNTNRVSAKKAPVNVSLGTSGVEAYVTGLQFGQANPQNNTQMFTIMMVTADVQA